MSRSIRPMGGMIRYRLRFNVPGGCPPGVLSDMARFDSAQVILTMSDDKCYNFKDEEPHVRTATLVGSYWPTMERWASFALGTVLEETVEGEAANAAP